MTMIETTVRPRAPIEVRKATITNVSFPQRIISLIAVPYNDYAVVEHPVGSGKFIEEAFEPGAFGNVQNRANRFLVNLEHDLDHVVGRVQSLQPELPEGLGADLFIRRGPEGDQVLADADDGMYGGSVGFAALPSNVAWEGRSRRRVLKAFLDHIGLTFTPAYTGTMPLAVRSQVATASNSLQLQPERQPTPNLDRILAERLARQYNL